MLNVVPQLMPPLCIPQKNSQTLEIETEYEFKDGDTLYFTAKKKPDNDNTDAEAVIATSWAFGDTCDYNADGNLELKLSASDTDINFGHYVYDIKLSNSEVDTTIIFGDLEILPVATLRA